MGDPRTGPDPIPVNAAVTPEDGHGADDDTGTPDHDDTGCCKSLRARPPRRCSRSLRWHSYSPRAAAAGNRPSMARAAGLLIIATIAACWSRPQLTAPLRGVALTLLGSMQVLPNGVAFIALGRKPVLVEP